MNANYRILLSSCLGFVIGFAACYCLRIACPDYQSEANVSLSPSAVPPASTAISVSYETIPTNTRSQPEFLGNTKIAPSILIPAEGWKVTIWHPTIPPQKAGTFDPYEYVARTMGLTNR